LAAEQSLIQHIEILLEFGADVNIRPMVIVVTFCKSYKNAMTILFHIFWILG